MPSVRRPSDHFARGRFFTPGASPQQFLQVLKWVAQRKPAAWPKFVPSEPGPAPASRVTGHDLVVTFVNHSTFLLQTAGLNLLTDPVWSERVSPFSFAGPRRHRNPGLRFEDLPPIDCILISHNHYDHLDLATLRRLARRDQPIVFSPLGLRPLLLRAGLKEIHELDWWEQHFWRDIEIHCVPAQHFSSRTPFDRDRTLWSGWIFGQPGYLTYFAGDTGFGPLFEQIAARFPDLELAILPIGAYEPEWFMGPIHMTPEQAVEAQRILDVPVAIASHFGTFSLADDAMTAPVERLEAALAGNLAPPTFLALPEGERWSLADWQARRKQPEPVADLT